MLLILEDVYASSDINIQLLRLAWGITESSHMTKTWLSIIVYLEQCGVSHILSLDLDCDEYNYVFSKNLVVY